MNLVVVVVAALLVVKPTTSEISTRGDFSSQVLLHLYYLTIVPDCRSELHLIDFSQSVLEGVSFATAFGPFYFMVQFDGLLVTGCTGQNDHRASSLIRMLTRIKVNGFLLPVTSS